MNESPSQAPISFRRYYALYATGFFAFVVSLGILERYGMPARWISWKGADITGRSASRAKRAAARLAGWVAMSRPTSIWLPESGATSVVT